MDYIEAIEDYLQAESAVTVHWLANELSIPSSEAIQLLQNYSKEREEEITKSHLVIGYDEDNQLIFKLVHGNNPVDVKRVLSKQIYSIQKSSSDNVSSAIVHSILHQTESLLLQDSLVQDRDSFIYNGLGQVKNSQVKVRLYGERVISSQNLQFKRSASTQGATMVRPVASHPKKESSTLSAAVAQSAMSFFEKTSSASKPAVTAPPATTIATPNENTPVINAPKFSVLPEKRRLEKQTSASKPSVDSEDEEWDVEIESVKKQKTVSSSLSAESSAVQSESVSKIETEKQESEDEESADETNVDNDKENKPRKKRSSGTKKKNVNIRGAMDDFMEDAAIEQHKMDVEQPQVQRKMKKVLVEKCSVDERGYFVTEMVWEEVPDDGISFVDTSFTSKVEPLKRSETDSSTKENKVNQTEEKKTVSDKPAAKPLQASSKAGTGKKQETKTTGGQQKSMMSFFSKK